MHFNQSLCFAWQVYVLGFILDPIDSKILQLLSSKLRVWIPLIWKHVNQCLFFCLYKLHVWIMCLVLITWIWDLDSQKQTITRSCMQINLYNCAVQKREPKKSKGSVAKMSKNFLCIKSFHDIWFLKKKDKKSVSLLNYKFEICYVQLHNIQYITVVYFISKLDPHIFLIV